MHRYTEKKTDTQTDTQTGTQLSGNRDNENAPVVAQQQQPQALAIQQQPPYHAEIRQDQARDINYIPIRREPATPTSDRQARDRNMRTPEANQQLYRPRTILNEMTPVPRNYYQQHE